MAKKTRTQLSADASNVNILDNTSQQVTPAKVRNQYTDERDSVINYVDDFTGSVGDLLTIGTDGESITWIPVSDVQTPPGGSTGDLQINAGGGNFGATTDIVITSGNVSIPNGNLSVDGNLSLESSLPILSLKDSDTINSAGRIDFKDGTNTVKANIGYNATDGFDFTTTSSFTFDGGDATFSGTVDINASEANTLQVNHSGGTLPTPSAGTVATFAKNNTVGSFAQISVISGVSGSASIEFGDIDDVNIGRVQYDNASNSLKLQSNNAVGLTIDNAQKATFSGDVSLANVVNRATSAVRLSGGSTTTTGANLQLNHDASGTPNDIIFRTDSNEVARYDYSQTKWKFSEVAVLGDLALSAYGSGSKTGTATYGLGVDGSGNVVETSASGASSGTWTPTFNSYSGPSITINSANYVVVGDLVYLDANFSVPTNTDTSPFAIFTSSFPFTPAIKWGLGMIDASNGGGVGCSLLNWNGSSNYIYFTDGQSTLNDVQYDELGSRSMVSISITYRKS